MGNRLRGGVKIGKYEIRIGEENILCLFVSRHGKYLVENCDKISKLILL